MSASEFLDFMREIGVTPKRVRCGVSVWGGLMGEAATTLRYNAAPPTDVIERRTMLVYGVPFKCDTALEPAAFEFEQ